MCILYVFKGEGDIWPYSWSEMRAFLGAIKYIHIVAKFVTKYK